MADDARATLRIVMEEIPDSHLVAALARDFEREHAGISTSHSTSCTTTSCST